MPRPTPKAIVRLYGIVAREKAICVIFRKGPSKLAQLIKWNTETNEIHEGQWLKQQLYVERGDLSPDGSLLAFFAGNRSHPEPYKKTYTAISRPPYFTALALWFKGDSWGGGALFESSTKLLLNDPIWRNRKPFVPDPGKICPLECSLLGAARGEDWPIELIRLERDGWVIESSKEQVVLTKTVGDYSLISQPYMNTYHLQRQSEELRLLDQISWADIDCNGTLLATSGFHILSASLHDAYEDRYHLIKDLQQGGFEEVKAPDWAKKW